MCLGWPPIEFYEACAVIYVVGLAIRVGVEYIDYRLRWRDDV